MSRSNRILCVQISSGRSVSATKAADSADGPRLSVREMRDSGRSGPRAERVDRGAEGSRATPAKSCLLTESERNASTIDPGLKSCNRPINTEARK